MKQNPTNYADTSPSDTRVGPNIRLVRPPSDALPADRTPPLLRARYALLLAAIAEEIVARRFSRARVAFAARQPIAKAPTAADAAQRNLPCFTPSAHLLNVSVHTAGQGWSGGRPARRARPQKPLSNPSEDRTRRRPGRPNFLLVPKHRYSDMSDKVDGA